MNFRYPLPALAPDIGRASIGVVATGLVVVAVPVGAFAFWIAAPLCMAFVVFGILTALRATMRIRVASDNVLVGPGARSVRLEALGQFRLDYYSTRRDLEEGWMQLTLADVDGGRLRVDSRLENFEYLVDAAAKAAQACGVALSAASIENLQALQEGGLRRGARRPLDGGAAG
jgi:hypothetical protein